MNKICTSLEQSQKLIELGIDINTADMYHAPDANIIMAEPYITKIEDETFILAYKGAVPAWNLSALLGVIKPVNNNTYTLRGTLDGGAMISFEEVTNVMFQEEEIIDAVFEMVLKLHELKML